MKPTSVDETLTIFDWDGTIQNTDTVKSSFGMILATLFKPVKKELINKISLSTDSIICTTRSKFFTWLIRLKCFFETFDFNFISDPFKVMTINEYPFYKEEHPFTEMSIREIGEIKCYLCLARYYYNKNQVFKYVVYHDDDMPDDQKPFVIGLKEDNFFVKEN